ncbi:VOC family protein [Rhizobium sp. RU36D]|uniref:VOC family protein n=1 Tax=Rhizobium sp. RU36D TaxID=1907415 RepID=UPI0009D7D101|nr:VOC family protein [Rhizobium sp. RU36D]SMD04679.1 Catechol 2,3-dioxygenase [Rhizobium sp. RU36D]
METPIRGIMETALYAADLEAAEAFYDGVLGLSKITAVPGRHVFFRCGAGVLLIFNPAATSEPPHQGSLPVPTHGTSGAGHACFRVEPAQLDDIVRRLGEHAIAIESDFRWPNGARSIYFRDPAGNSLECAEPALWDL